MRAINYYKPTSIEDAYSKLQENPKNALLAGGLWLKKLGGEYETLIDLSSLGLNKIEEDDKVIKVGAMVSQREFETSPCINALLGGTIAFSTREVMGPAFRNMATIGASIYGRYPFSDVIAGLLMLDVELVFYPEQRMTLADYISFKGKVNGILTGIEIKKEEGKGYFKKVKTTALDFPLLNVAVSSRNGKYYIAIGSRPMVASYAYKAMEAANEGKSFEEVAKIAAEEYSFADSQNISKEYRKDLATVYVRRGLEEVSK